MAQAEEGSEQSERDEQRHGVCEEALAQQEPRELGADGVRDDCRGVDILPIFLICVGKVVHGEAQEAVITVKAALHHSGKPLVPAPGVKQQQHREHKKYGDRGDNDDARRGHAGQYVHSSFSLYISWGICQLSLSNSSISSPKSARAESMLSGQLMSTPAILSSDIGSVLDPPERKRL